MVIKNEGHKLTLEVVQSSAVLRDKLVRNSGTSSTSSAGDDGRATRGDGEDTEVLGDLGLVSVGGALGSNAGELLEVNSTRAAHGVVGCDKILLVREEELERAGLALEGSRDVEVEDGGEGGVDTSEVLGSVGSVGRVLVNGHNQVRVLVLLTGDTLGASAGGGDSRDSVGGSLGRGSAGGSSWGTG